MQGLRTAAVHPRAAYAVLTTFDHFRGQGVELRDFSLLNDIVSNDAGGTNFSFVTPQGTAFGLEFSVDGDVTSRVRVKSEVFDVTDGSVVGRFPAKLSVPVYTALALRYDGEYVLLAPISQGQCERWAPKLFGTRFTDLVLSGAWSSKDELEAALRVLLPTPTEEVLDGVA